MSVLEWLIALVMMGLLGSSSVLTLTTLQRHHNRLSAEMWLEVELGTAEWLLRQDVWVANEIRQSLSNQLTIVTLDQDMIEYQWSQGELRRRVNGISDTIAAFKNTDMDFSLDGQRLNWTVNSANSQRQYSFLSLNIP